MIDTNNNYGIISLKATKEEILKKLKKGYEEINLNNLIIVSNYYGTLIKKDVKQQTLKKYVR